MATKSNSKAASKGLKVSESASEEMTEAVLRKRAVKRFQDANKVFSEREFFLSLGARSEEAAAVNKEASLKAGEILRLQNILIGEDKEALIKHYDNDATKIDQFVMSVMNSQSVKKA